MLSQLNCLPVSIITNLLDMVNIVNLVNLADFAVRSRLLLNCYDVGSPIGLFLGPHSSFYISPTFLLFFRKTQLQVTCLTFKHMSMVHSLAKFNQFSKDLNL